jgi:hypothetical protein
MTPDLRNIRLAHGGRHGSGKTSTWFYFHPESTVYLDFEGGTDWLPRTEDHTMVVGPDQLQTVPQVTNVIQRALSNEAVRTVIVDSADRLHDVCERALAEENGVRATDEVSYGRASKPRDATFRSLALLLLNSGKGVVFISHIAHDEGIGANVLSLHPKVRDWLCEQVSFVWQSEQEDGQVRLFTQPAPGRDCKSRVRLPNPLPLPDSEPDPTAPWKAIEDALTEATARRFNHPTKES